MDDALVATEWQGETTTANAGVTEPKEPSTPGLSRSPACSTETPPIIPLLPDLPFEGTMGHPFFESLASPLQKKRDYSPSGSFSDHHSMRTQVSSLEVEVRSEHNSTWGDDYMPKLIPETGPSSGQWRQESSSSLLVPSGLSPILMTGQPQAAQRVLEIRHLHTWAYQGETWWTLI